MKLTDVIRQTQKEYRTSMNKIAAIKLVRSLTGCAASSDLEMEGFAAVIEDK